MNQPLKTVQSCTQKHNRTGNCNRFVQPIIVFKSILNRGSLELSNFKKFTLQWFFAIFIGIVSLMLPARSYAQIYPVQGSVFGQGMFSGTLNAMSDGQVGGLQAQFVFNDIFSSDRDVYLKMHLKGGLIDAASRPDARNNPELVYSIAGGDVLMLDATEIGKYLKFENMQNIGMLAYQNLLAEGTYLLTVEMFDYNTNLKISNTSNFVFSIYHGNPPVLNLPACNTTIYGNDVSFSWIPASSFSGAVIEYEIQFVELTFDTDVNAAFLTAEQAGYYKQITGIASSPELVNLEDFNPGTQYGYRILAHTMHEGEEVNTLSQGGYSDKCIFTYGGTQDIPTCPQIISIDGCAGATSNSVRVEWQVDGAIQQFQKFEVGYRPVTEPPLEFFTEQTTKLNFTITNLVPNTQYEVRVCPVCVMNVPDNCQSCTFTTPNIQAVFKCGDDPETTTPILTTALKELFPGDVFYVNNLPVVVNEHLVTADGIFNGSGRLTLVFKPLQGYVPAIEVVLENVVIDATNNKMVGGVVRTAYDPNWGGVIDLNAFTQGGSLQAELMSGAIEPNLDVPGTITGVGNIELSDDKLSIEVVYSVNNGGSYGTVIYEIDDVGESGLVVIKDIDNQYYSVNTETGEVTLLGIMHEDVSELLANIDQNSIDKDHQVTFAAYDDDNTFDAGFAGDYANCSDYSDKYSSIRLGNTMDSYSVPWKFVETGSARKVKVNMPAGFVMPADETQINPYQFVTNFGAELVLHGNSTDGYYIDVPSGEAASNYELYVIYHGETDDVQAGKLMVRTENHATYDVVIVPVESASTGTDTEIKSALDNIFAPYGVSWNVEVFEKFAYNIGDGIHAKDKYGSEYSDDQIALQQAFKAQYPERTRGKSVVFVINGQFIGGFDGQTGDMPINRKYGYLFGGLNARSLAHELGHGVLTLRHTFDLCTSPDAPGLGQTTNLMDYADGTQLNRFQWEAIHNPALIGKMFQDDEDGATYYVDINDKVAKFFNMIACSKMTGETFLSIENDFAPSGGNPQYLSCKFNNVPIQLNKNKLPSQGQITIDIENPVITDDGDNKIVKYNLNPSSMFSYFEFKISGDDFQNIYNILNGVDVNYIANLVDNIPEETGSEFFSYLAQLPECAYYEISNDNRIKYLKWLVDESTNADLEQLIVNLIEFVKIENAKALLNEIDSEKLHKKLYQALDNKQLRTEYVSALHLYWQSNMTKAEVNPQQASFNLKLGRWDKIANKINFNLVGDKLVLYEPYTYWKEFKYPDLSTEWQLVTDQIPVFDIEPLGQVSVLFPDKEDPVVIPAIVLKNLTDNENREALLLDIKQAVNFTLLAVGSLEIASGIAAVGLASSRTQYIRAVISLFLGVSDVTATAFTTACDGFAMGSEFCDEWAKVEDYVNYGLLAGSALDMLVGGLLKNIDDIYSSTLTQAQKEEILIGLGVSRQANELSNEIKAWLQSLPVGTLNKLDNLSIDELTYLYAKINKYPNLATDLTNVNFADAIFDNVELVESWKKLLDANVDDVLRRNTGALEALNTTKGSRKAPSTYLDQSYIDNHLAKFDEGSSRIVNKADYNEYGVGKPDEGMTEFVFPKSEMDEILSLPNAEKAKKLGIPESQLDGELVRIDFKSTDKIDMPSGNEFGANDQWIPGGKTNGGVSEAVVKTEGMQLNVDYTVNDL